MNTKTVEDLLIAATPQWQKDRDAAAANRVADSVRPTNPNSGVYHSPPVAAPAQVKIGDIKRPQGGNGIPLKLNICQDDGEGATVTRLVTFLCEDVGDAEDES